jgi:hypothetical protein
MALHVSLRLIHLSLHIYLPFVLIDYLPDVIRRSNINPPRSRQTYHLTMYLTILLHILLYLLLPVLVLLRLRNPLLHPAHPASQFHPSIFQAMDLSKNLLLLPTATIET